VTLGLLGRLRDSRGVKGIFRAGALGTDLKSDCNTRSSRRAKYSSSFGGRHGILQLRKVRQIFIAIAARSIDSVKCKFKKFKVNKARSTYTTASYGKLARKDRTYKRAHALFWRAGGQVYSISSPRGGLTAMPSLTSLG
jgi:hypothetical protein